MKRDPIPQQTSEYTFEKPTETHITAIESDYWQKFYEKNDFNEGSSFCELVKAMTEIPQVIVDIGCGQGRDSVAFGNSGKTVLGLDRSEEGVAHASQHAALENIDNVTKFAVCDVSDRESVAGAISVARELANGGNVCFYMRFFLHSIPEEVQEKLMATLSEEAVAGDVFAVEFRTDKDAEMAKAFGVSHYRRYQNAADFSQKLSDEYGWDKTILEIESQGLSPYGNEDPVLYRVIATR